MLKALKITGIVIGVIIVLIIAAVLIIPQVIDPNDYRDDIEAAVARHTDRTLAINGDIELSLFPWLGLEVHQAKLSNAPGFGKQPFATIDDMQVQVRLLSLIGDHPEVGTLKLSGLELNLARNAQGKTNWQDLLGPRGGQSEGEGSSKSRFGDITIDSIQLRGATINWSDAKSDVQYRVRDANVTVGEVHVGQSFPVKMDFALDRVRPVLHANVGIKTTATIYPDAKQYQLTNGMIEIAARGAGLPAQPTQLKANWKNLQLDQTAGTFELKDLSFNALGVQAHAVLQGSGLNAKPRITGILVVPDFSPRKVLAKMGRKLQLQDPTVLQRASLSADIDATGKSAALNNVNAALDGTHFSGHLAMTDFDTHALAFDLTVDKLDADRYLPAGKENAAKQAPIGAIDYIRLPGERLRGLNLNGKLTVGTFSLLDMTANDVTVGLHAADGEMTLKPLAAKLYGGSYKGTVTAAAAGQGLKLSASQQLDGIHFGTLLQDLLGKKLLSGVASMNIAFNGQGDTVGALKKTLDGKVGFKVQHGAIEGVDLWAAIRRADAILKHQKPPENTGPKRTEFVAMSGSGVIKKGVLNNDDFRADLPFMHLSGSGKVDLVRRNVDYDVKAKIIKVPKIEGRAELDQLKGYTIPIHFAGDFQSISAYPELGKVLKERAKKEAQHRLEEKKKALKKKLNGKKQDLKKKAEDKLKSLFSGA
ncbi:MAG TPA: AsmA family protein [Gammaproteobacteria bacterium]|nr:AsmA family protein [Gammaproteobacteria bacterium]